MDRIGGIDEDVDGRSASLMLRLFMTDSAELSQAPLRVPGSWPQEVGGSRTEVAGAKPSNATISDSGAGTTAAGLLNGFMDGVVSLLVNPSCC